MGATRFQKHAATAPRPAKESGGARPLLILLGARVIYVGAGLQLSPHRNAVAVWALGLDHPFELSRLGKADGKILSTRQALIPAGARHHLRTRGRMLFLYVDALSADLDCLSTSAQADAGLIVERAEALLAASDTQAVLAGLQALLAALGIPAGASCSAALADTIRAIDERPQAFPRLALAARHAGLSPSHFQHQLKAITGVPFRRYRLLRRMAVVMRSLDTGRSLTEAALEAGFSSSAHLSTAFRDLFGLSPSMLMAARPRLLIAREPAAS